MSTSPYRSPADAFPGAGTGAGSRHPQETRGSAAPSPACARSPHRWAAPLQRGCLVPPQRQVSLLLLLRLLHLPRRRMPRYPPTRARPRAYLRDPERSRHGKPRRSGERCRSRPAAELPQPRPAPAPPAPAPAPAPAHLPLGSARSRLPQALGERGKARSPRGEAVPGGDTHCGRRGSL